MRQSEDAIVIEGVVKSFRKSTIRGGEYTTFKTELLRWLRGQRQGKETRLIEALRGIDLRVPRGKTMAILGRNGSGKSTLLKLITGIYTPTSGRIEVNGRISALLDLGAGFHPDFSGRENILINGIILGMTRAEVYARMDDIIAFSELGEFIDEPVRTYSSGMYMRLAFAVATHVDPDILIVDEILAVGDEHFSKKSLAKMTEFKRQGKTIVVVTHDLKTVERWCDLAAWIDGGRIRRLGTPKEVAEEYRQAVSLAEERSTVFLPPALASEGLPEVPGADGSHEEPQAEAAPLAISRLRLLEAGGAEVHTLAPEQRVEVCAEYSARAEVEGAEFELVLKTADGKLLYVTSTRVDGVEVPARLPPSGRVRFVFERLGLLGGEYTLRLGVRVAGQTLEVGPAGQCTFSVLSEQGDQGLFRPQHRWVLEGAETEPRAESQEPHAVGS